MSYTKLTDFAVKDSLLSGNPAKVIRGTEIDAEFDAIAASDAQNITPTSIVAATSKATPVDADLLPLVDSAASNTLKKLTWANLKATAKTYFDALYLGISATATNASQLLGNTWASPGPIGSTTPNTGAFTTLSTTGNVTLGDASTDTLNVGNGGLIKDAAGNLGLGVTPSAWSSNWKSMQFGPYAAVTASLANTSTYLMSNAYLSGGQFIYTGSAVPTAAYGQSDGQHRFLTAPSGTAGNVISFTEAMTLDASGNVGIGGTLTGNVNGNVTGNLTGNVTGNTSGTAANVTGTVAITNGGTGSATAAGARTNLGAATSGPLAGSGITGAAASGANTDITSITGNAATATTASNALGVGQSWTDFTGLGTRLLGTNYTNSTGRTIIVSVTVVNASGSDTAISINGIDGMLQRDQSLNDYTAVTAAVPTGSVYNVRSPGYTAVARWTELR